MKRKLNDSDVPTEVTAALATKADSAFADLGLEPRLLQAIVQQKFSKPTLVQSKAIPLALEGKDILGRSQPTSLCVPGRFNTSDTVQLGPKLAQARPRRMCFQYFKRFFDGKA